VLDPDLFHVSPPQIGRLGAGSTAADQPPVLLGGRCEQDGTVVFPFQESCPRCSGRAMSELALPGHGTLWSWTVQHFAPKSPYRGPIGPDFVPYPVGYVDLGEVIVESRLQIADVAALRIGMSMTATWLRIWTDAEGHDVLTYAFAPSEAGES
jgi:uncharacterized OB-fold protein